MGTKNVKRFSGIEEKKEFTDRLLQELNRLQDLIDNDEIESNVYRIGAELEIFLINDNGSPAAVSPEVLEKLPDCFTSEYSDYLVELNLRPNICSSASFSNIKSEVESQLSLLADILEEFNCRYVLVGILPSFEERHLRLDSITDDKRFHYLHDFVHGWRHKDHETYINGLETYEAPDGLKPYSGAVASYQMHYQVTGNNAVQMLNRAQLLTPPLLAIAANSPIFMGKVLWHESRIPLFDQSTDHRDWRDKMLGEKPRVFFGDEWFRGSVKDIYLKEFADYDLWLSTEVEEEEDTQYPALSTLLFQNGLIYRWNRLCYGLLNDVPTLRIENRYIAAGPSLEDNLDMHLFWTSLMAYDGEYFDGLIEDTDFWRVRESFNSAGQFGISSMQYWEGKWHSAERVVKEYLLPIARESLRKIDMENEEYRLDRIEKRLEEQITGSSLQIEKYESMSGTASKRGKELSLYMSSEQYDGKSIVEWSETEIQTKPETAADIKGTKPLRVKSDYPINYVKSLCDGLGNEYVAIVSYEDGSDFCIKAGDIKNAENLEDVSKFKIKSVSIDTPIDRLMELKKQGDEVLALEKEKATIKVIRTEEI